MFFAHHLKKMKVTPSRVGLHKKKQKNTSEFCIDSYAA
jgi:hypothetical protein